MSKRVYSWFDERLKLESVAKALRESTPEQRHPPSLTVVFSVGRISAVLILLLVVTGALMTLFYIPTPEQAFDSIQHMQTTIPFGWLIRGVHRWSALLAMAFVVLHLLRVALMQAFHYPRDLNWQLGIGLLLLVLLFGATGYLLRWDIKAFTLMLLIKDNLKAIPLIGDTLVAVVLGGTELGTVPLSRGYGVHIWFLPLVLTVLLGAHLLIAWRQGLAQTYHRWQRRISLAPAAYRRLRFLPGLLILALALILAGTIPAQEPVTGPTDQSPIPHPDWLFVFYVLPFWFFKGSWRPLGSFVIPAAIILLLVALPRFRKVNRRSLGGVAMAIVGILWVLWLFTQVGRMGAQVPAQGCAACHKPTIVGGAPVHVADFEELGSDWLVRHLQDPPRSLIEPFTSP
jgi:quinol-cytochrome oxidoreductase complex cytochrome b subunit